MSKQDTVNWKDPALERWLNTIMKASTRYVYRSAFRVYAEFTGMTGSALIDEALEDLKRDPRMKKDVVLQRLISFYNWCKTEYPRKSRGKGEHKVLGKGVSDKLAYLYVGAIRSFYATFSVTVRMKGRHSLPKPRVTNKRMKVNAEQVKVLVDHARSPRDRAIILTLFQSGIDVSTLCSLRYGDIAEGLAAEEHPLKLELYRQKSGIEFYTFLGKDAVLAIKAYLADTKARGISFQHDTPLFLKVKGKQAMTTNLVQNMMRAVALKTGFINKENNGKAFNPLGPHALRESFGSIMINNGVPDTIVDFWLGHSIGEMAQAYKSVQFKSLRKSYLERERLLNISARGLDEEELEEKVSQKVDERVEVLRRIIRRCEDENRDINSRMRLAEKKLESMEEIIHKIRLEIESN